MARETARRKEKHVDALIVPSSNEAGSDALRRGDDAPEPPGIYSKIKVNRICSPLYFHECYDLSAAGDKIDFAARCFHSLGEDSPTLEAQVPSGKGLSAPAETLPFGAIHLSSIARA